MGTTVRAVGLPGFHYDDLRHTGNALAADTGATLADLMARMPTVRLGRHDLPHASARRDRSIAEALSVGIAEQRDRARSGHETDIQASR